MQRTPDDPIDQDKPDEDQDEAAQSSRQTGGDAPAAASLEEREAVAEDRDHLFGPSPDQPDE